jgi:hypothetical protein
MDTNGDFACAELRGDLFAQTAHDDKWQNLSLAAGQPGVFLSQVPLVNYGLINIAPRAKSGAKEKRKPMTANCAWMARSFVVSLA